MRLVPTAFHRALETLDDAGFIHYSNIEREGCPGVGGTWWQDLIVTGEGKQALGDWPYFDGLGQRETLATIVERLPIMPRPRSRARDYRRTANAIRMLCAGTRAFIVGALSAHLRTTLGLP